LPGGFGKSILPFLQANYKSKLILTGGKFMYSQEDIARNLESLTILLRASAEDGVLDDLGGKLTADVLEVMGWLSALLRQGAAA
jgi:hypothetical protein